MAKAKKVQEEKVENVVIPPVQEVFKPYRMKMNGFYIDVVKELEDEKGKIYFASDGCSYRA